MCCSIVAVLCCCRLVCSCFVIGVLFVCLIVYRWHIREIPSTCLLIQSTNNHPHITTEYISNKLLLYRTIATIPTTLFFLPASVFCVLAGRSEMAHYNGFGTKAIHVGVEPDPTSGAVITPISLSTTFQQSSPGVHQV